MSRRAYTRDELLGPIDDFVERHGRPPSWSEWRRATDRPGFHAYARAFGSWTNALIEAGYEPRGYASEKYDENVALQARVDAGETLGAVARELGISRQALGRRLRRHRKSTGRTP